NLRIVGWALHSAIPAEAVIATVEIVLAVRLIVLVLVCGRITQREAVVAGHVVDAGSGPPTALSKQIARAGEPLRERAQDAWIAAPEASHRVAIQVVPFRPRRRETSQVVTIRPDVPRLGDELHVTQRRLGRHRLEKARV